MGAKDGNGQSYPNISAHSLQQKAGIASCAKILMNSEDRVVVLRENGYNGINAGCFTTFDLCIGLSKILFLLYNYGIIISMAY